MEPNIMPNPDDDPAFDIDPDGDAAAYDEWAAVAGEPARPPPEHPQRDFADGRASFDAITSSLMVEALECWSVSLPVKLGEPGCRFVGALPSSIGGLFLRRESLARTNSQLARRSKTPNLCCAIDSTSVLVTLEVNHTEQHQSKLRRLALPTRPQRSTPVSLKQWRKSLFVPAMLR
jgi:hypothetical protein